MRKLVNFSLDYIIKNDLIRDLEEITYLESMFGENKKLKVKRKGERKNGKYQRK